MAFLGCLSLLSTAAHAHVPFLKPNQFQVTHGRFQVESAFTEQPFQADFAMDSPNFTMLLPDGQTQALQPTAKTRAAVYLEPQLLGEGTYRISTGVRTGPLIKAVAAQGKLYFAKEMASVVGQKNQVRYDSRADVYVSKGAASYHPQPVNIGLEIIPLSAPTALHSGARLKLQVLQNGKPQPGLRITVVQDGQQYRQAGEIDFYAKDPNQDANQDTSAQAQLLTDALGQAIFAPQQAGLYYFLVGQHEQISPELWQSHNAVLTLEVKLPSPAQEVN